jgi:molecular chaperone GrpE
MSESENQEEKLENNEESTGVDNSEEVKDPKDDAQEVVEENLSDLEKAEIEIKKLKADLDEAKASEMRTKAEMMNFRKRIEKDKSNWNQLTIKDLVGSLLDPLDNLDRTIEAAENTADYESNTALKGLGEGVKMVVNQFVDILDRKNVKSIYPKGELFNPNEHEAYAQVESDEVEEGHVVNVFRKGYKIGDILIRTATVQVAKKPVETEDAETSEEAKD